jgi:hypothetical protein
VSTTFTQPAVKCSSGDQYSSFWVGLDGYSSDSVEQTGTEADCVGKTAEYSAWYELYPAYPVTYSNTVKARRRHHRDGHLLRQQHLHDDRQGHHRGLDQDHDQDSSGDARSSAEVIAEAPYSGGVLPAGRLRHGELQRLDRERLLARLLRPDRHQHGLLLRRDRGDHRLAQSGGSFAITWNSK